MKRLQYVSLALADDCPAVTGVMANVAMADPAHPTEGTTARQPGAGNVKAKERVVTAFLQGVVNEHQASLGNERGEKEAESPHTGEAALATTAVFLDASAVDDRHDGKGRREVAGGTGSELRRWT